MKLRFLAIFAFFLISLFVVFYFQITIQAKENYDYRSIVHGIDKLHKDAEEIPPHFRQDFPQRTGSEFDPNTYFSVLKHLSLPEGYQLDYVYFYSGWGASPTLYIRSKEDKPFKTYKELNKTLGLHYKQKKILEYIRLDETPESYFEFIVFKELSGQFYIIPHGPYNDTRIVTTKEDIKEILALDENYENWATDYFSHNDWPIRPLSENQREQARTINPTTKIEFKDNKVEVTYIIFTGWGGFIRRTVIINRAFPHKILKSHDETIIQYSCGRGF